MDDKKKMVDYPGYQPNAQVPFPPVGAPASPFGSGQGKRPQQKQDKTPYYENYIPDPPAPDPSQVLPGAPNIRDIDTKVPEDALAALSPDNDLSGKGR